MGYHTDLETLKNRFQTFIEKLDHRAQELEAETRASAQMFYDEDEDEHKRSYNQFQMGIKGQFKNILDKSNQVFETKILPVRQSNRYPNVNIWYKELYTLKNDFETKIWSTMEDIFDSVEQVSSEVSLQKILEEYEEIKNAFYCEQCGANLVIDKIYFVSTYITCPYCQTQNTFIPGSRTQSLQFLAREIAEERMLPLAKRVTRLKIADASKIEQALAYNYYRVRIWLEKVRVLPDFFDEFLKVYYREIHEYLYNYNSKKIDIPPDLYKAMLEQFGFTEESLDRLNAAQKEINDEKLFLILKDWEKLLALSSFILPQLYQANQQEEVYNRNFRRVQETWEYLAGINKQIEDRDIMIEKAINDINNKFK